MATSTLTVDEIENRGSSEVPFGFVYFSDGLRVPFSQTNGIGHGSNWGPVSERHRTIAREALTAAGIVLSRSGG